VPQRDDQGPGGAGDRELRHGARQYGVEDHVLPTLQETFPQIDWSQAGRLLLQPRGAARQAARGGDARSGQHVREAGFAPLMATAAIADKQQWVADLAAAGVFAGLPKDAPWQDYADRLIEARKLQS
jgi:hypothetical protein